MGDTHSVRESRTRFLALRVVSPAQKNGPPSTQTASTGLTWGAPSGRTVANQ
jgi:hypothetical protein